MNSKRGALFDTSPHKQKKPNSCNATNGAQKMETHRLGVLLFFYSTLLSNIFPFIPVYPISWHHWLLQIKPLTRYHNAAVRKGMAAVFLLAYFSCIATFSPGCRSPPILFVFATPSKTNGGNTLD
jgi:hypothetical protein